VGDQRGGSVSHDREAARCREHLDARRSVVPRRKRRATALRLRAFDGARAVAHGLAEL
jgi:hypothetical protein